MGKGEAPSAISAAYFKKQLANGIDYCRRSHYAKNMKPHLCATVRTAIAEGLSHGLQLPISEEQIRLPARGAAAGCAAALSRGADADAWARQLHAAREKFPRVLDAPLLSSVTAEHGWLLFHLHEDFYAAAADAIAIPKERIPTDHECYPLHRLRMLARYESRGCPNDAAVQRALLLCLAANEAPTAANRARAEEAILTMAHHLPPAERITLLSACGCTARAMAALLYNL